MSATPLASGDSGKSAQITILLVDDIPETRENIKKLLAFEADMKVVGGANTGREGVEMAKEFKPDIIIMDINMPDMDGLQATGLINKAVPQSAVIIMSVQDDVDYMRRAMLAGARDFLAKPVNIDDLTNTIRAVYRNHEAIRRQYAMSTMATPADALKQAQKSEGTSGERAGHIVVVYSPQGGTGVTTIATGLATSLMRKGIRVLLADADLSFGDVATFLAVQPQATILELLPDADDLDPEHFDNIVTTHASGLKVLAAPPRPEMAEEVRGKRPGVVAHILSKVRSNYDYIIVDTATALDEVNLPLFDLADRIVLVSVTSLPSVKNARFILDLFDKIGYEPDRAQVVLNKVYAERDRKGSTLETARIQQFLKRPILVEIPVVDERVLMGAVLKGVPITIAERDKSKPPVKQLSELAERLSDMLAGSDSDAASESGDTSDKKSGKFRLGGGR